MEFALNNTKEKLFFLLFISLELCGKDNINASERRSQVCIAKPNFWDNVQKNFSN